MKEEFNKHKLEQKIRELLEIVFIPKHKAERYFNLHKLREIYKKHPVLQPYIKKKLYQKKELVILVHNRVIYGEIIKLKFLRW